MAAGRDIELGEQYAFRSVNDDERASSPNSVESLIRPPDYSWRAMLRYSLSSSRIGRKKAYINRAILVISILVILGIIAAIVYLSLVITLIHRLAPRATSNGLQSIVNTWKSPRDSTALLSPWQREFSRDTNPVPCHSHNDYTRDVPLYDALNVGCMSVEADIWLRKDANGNDDLLVGHTSRSLKPDRTLRSLYLDPILTILKNQNTESQFGDNDTPVGVFDADPDTSLVLALDFKTDGAKLWPHVMSQLEPLRQRGWLTCWDGSTDQVKSRPLTIVGTGSTPFESVMANTTYRDVFFDAPLDDISNPKYNTTNSYYASVSLSQAVGKPWLGKFSSKQLNTIKSQIEAASKKGLTSRYWDTVSWPIAWRDNTWKVLVKNGVGMLNVDDLVSAAKWNWDWCVIAGLILCG